MKVTWKAIAWILLVAMALSAVACADNGGKDNKGTTEEEKERALNSAK